ncbi:MAG: AAA family ATPase [Pseudanabaenaceae cyanobacterium bins.68]|nr:AAA family ATPase [Pseudanabaenaceae cyanobacterium bins.68]
MTPSLPGLIQQMLQADFYSHPVDTEIRLIQTHISFVILTGEFAYKVKKAVNFGFLDFSSLDQRRFFCAEELRLNSRLAPQLYLEVLPIYLAGDRYGFSSEGGIAEYTVKMRQFDQANLLSNLFAQDQVTAAQVQEIGIQLAKFHTQAETSPEITAFGSSAAVRQVAEDNYHSTAKYIGIAQTQLQFDQTRAFTEQCFSQQEHLFEQRQHQGKIKECHGDLHLKNICLYGGNVQIFDCIEFNQAFRNSDVVYDAAFLVMDLEFRGRRDLANLFLNTYLEQSGDYSALALLPLYLSMRAYIRAKVTSFLLDDPNIAPDLKQSAQIEATAYYTLAWQYTQTGTGSLILMCGLSGTGKSTVAAGLAPKVQAIQIRSDAVRKHLGGIPLNSRGDQQLYSPEMTSKTYQTLIDYGVTLARAGFRVILDAKFDQVEQRSQALAQAAGIPVKILYCQADQATLTQRLSDRAAANTDIADATADLLSSQIANFATFTAQELNHLISLDTRTAIDWVALIEQLGFKSWTV